jgi:hypothetical protein
MGSFMSTFVNFVSIKLSLVTQKPLSVVQVGKASHALTRVLKLRRLRVAYLHMEVANGMT